MDKPARFAVTVETVDARALAGNPLGDPARRELPIVHPVGCDPAQPLPLVLLLAGFSGRGAMMLADDDPWAEGLVARLDRLAADGRIGPMLLALPDAFTRYGGSQYLNSDGTGRYEDYLWDDLLPAVRRRFAVGAVGLAGKSSGGYGALVQAMRHPDRVAAVASVSGDLYFEYGYLLDFPKVARTLRRHGGVAGFLAHFAQAAKKREGKLLEAMNILAMAACYSPDPRAPERFALPFDVETGEIDAAVWARWLPFDPVRMIETPACVEALRRMRLVHVECGTRDEYFLENGARMFVRKLRERGVAVHHEEFDDGHMGINYRYDVVLPALYAALRAVR